MVLAAGEGASDGADVALEKLRRAYWWVGWSFFFF
jgi:hypothetical protein